MAKEIKLIFVIFAALEIFTALWNLRIVLNMLRTVRTVPRIKGRTLEPENCVKHAQNSQNSSQDKRSQFGIMLVGRGFSSPDDITRNG